jgi:hypothetical protein
VTQEGTVPDSKAIRLCTLCGRSAPHVLKDHAKWELELDPRGMRLERPRYQPSPSVRWDPLATRTRSAEAL